MHSFIVFAADAATVPGAAPGERTIDIQQMAIKSLRVAVDPTDDMAFRGVLLLHCTDIREAEDEGTHDLHVWFRPRGK